MISCFKRVPNGKKMIMQAIETENQDALTVFFAINLII